MLKADPGKTTTWKVFCCSDGTWLCFVHMCSFKCSSTVVSIVCLELGHTDSDTVLRFVHIAALVCRRSSCSLSRRVLTAVRMARNLSNAVCVWLCVWLLLWRCCYKIKKRGLSDEIRWYGESRSGQISSGHAGQADVVSSLFDFN